MLFFAVLAEACLRVMPLRRTAKLFGVGLGALSAEAAASEPVPAWALARLRVVALVMRRWPVDGTCLREALVSGQRLRALDPCLRIGVKSRGVAHAWLEVGGRSLDPASEQYHELLGL